MLSHAALLWAAARFSQRSVCCKPLTACLCALCGRSILLLPRVKEQGPDKTTPAHIKKALQEYQNASAQHHGHSTLGRSKNGKGNSSSKQPQREQHPVEVDIREWEYGTSSLPGAAVSEVNWSNSCIFNLCQGRGPVVQPPATWPLSCSAAKYSAMVLGDMMYTGDFHKQ